MCITHDLVGRTTHRSASVEDQDKGLPVTYNFRIIYTYIQNPRKMTPFTASFHAAGFSRPGAFLFCCCRAACASLLRNACRPRLPSAASNKSQSFFCDDPTSYSPRRPNIEVEEGVVGELGGLGDSK